MVSVQLLLPARFFSSFFSFFFLHFFFFSCFLFWCFGVLVPPLLPLTTIVASHRSCSWCSCWCCCLLLVVVVGAVGAVVVIACVVVVHVVLNTCVFNNFVCCWIVSMLYYSFHCILNVCTNLKVKAQRQSGTGPTLLCVPPPPHHPISTNPTQLDCRLLFSECASLSILLLQPTHFRRIPSHIVFADIYPPPRMYVDQEIHVFENKSIPHPCCVGGFGRPPRLYFQIHFIAIIYTSLVSQHIKIQLFITTIPIYSS